MRIMPTAQHVLIFHRYYWEVSIKSAFVPNLSYLVSLTSLFASEILGIVDQKTCICFLRGL